MTEPYHADNNVTLHHGDCLVALQAMPDNSVDSIVTDPPYGLSNTDPKHVAETLTKWVTGDHEYTPPAKGGFMGKTWDSFVPPPAVWIECMRVLKPGGHLLVFAGSRTQDLMGLSIRLAGFELRDSLAWIYGSGFPKSMDVSKAIDKDNGRKFEDRFALGRHIRERREALGLTTAEVNGWFGYRDGCQHWERQDRSGARVPTLADWRILRERLDLSDEHLPLVERVEAEREVVGKNAWTNSVNHFVPGEDHTQRVHTDITAPATPEAERWDGWGTALKPSHEPVLCARKPLTGTVAANVLEWGTGALNIDASRVGTEGGTERKPHDGPDRLSPSGAFSVGRGPRSISAGRWPANVLLDPEAAAAMDQQSGIASPKKARTGRKGGCSDNGTLTGYGSGDDVGTWPADPGGGASRFFPVFKYQAKAPKKERPVIEREDGTKVQHPTVKPLALMEWLVTLITPPGGVVLDPFAGSGTTLQAARDKGFRSVGVEADADHCELIVARLSKDDGGLFAA